MSVSHKADVLTIDVGNSEITVARWRGAERTGRWRLTTSVLISAAPSSASAAWRAFLADELGDDLPAQWGLASVVPLVSELVVDCAAQRGNTSVVVASHRSPWPFRVAVDEPSRVGVDRLVNVLAAWTRSPVSAICIDAGTATTVDALAVGAASPHDAIFVGGAIVPGVATQFRGLAVGTAQLPSIDAREVVRGAIPAIGRNTLDAIHAGVVLGAAGALDALVARFRAEWPLDAQPPQTVYLTGGFGRLLSSLLETPHVLDPDLTLAGLRRLVERAGDSVSSALG